MDRTTVCADDKYVPGQVQMIKTTYLFLILLRIQMATLKKQKPPLILVLPAEERTGAH